MNRSQNEYEDLIRSSILFSLDKEKEKTAYERESRKMVEYFYCYLISINEYKYGEMGCEITETACSCIKSYKPEKGEFLHYFNKSFQNAYRKATGKQLVADARAGINVANSDDKLIRKVMKYASSHGISSPDKEQLEELAAILDIPEETVLAVIQSNSELGVVTSLSGKLDDEIDAISTIQMLDEYDFIESDTDRCMALLTAIEDAYLTCQERSKPIISAMMTIKAAEVIKEKRLDISGLSFVDEEILKMELLPTQRDIASKFGKNEASISRTCSEFSRKIMPYK